MLKKSKKPLSKTKKGGAGPGDFLELEKRIKKVDEFPPEFKLVLYGRAGTAKTTIASSFPKPLLLLDASEKGTDSIRDVPGVHVLRLNDWDDLVNAYWYVKQTKKFKTVVIDTVSNCQDLAIRKVMEDNGKEAENIGGWGTMTKRDWGKVSSMLKDDLITNYVGLEGMNVVMIAHDRVSGGSEEDDSTEGMILPEVGPRLMPSVASYLNGAVSIIGNTFVREVFKEITIGKGPKAKKINKRKIEYCLRVGPHAYYVTKIRKPKSVMLPDVIVDATYEKIQAVVKGQTAE